MGMEKTNEFCYSLFLGILVTKYLQYTVISLQNLLAYLSIFISADFHIAVICFLSFSKEVYTQSKKCYLNFLRQRFQDSDFWNDIT
ncbi:hypothetical protein V144x_12540 [Gimesia aquarii]|uniref:Uncharacterized protein n=1 Tax=Gimesia aquarii TaxID=2527964 RepID=A0A517VS39_9PLAN|nr:hypothetical protein V144x_12540 [Gimesia aquarii]